MAASINASGEKQGSWGLKLMGPLRLTGSLVVAGLLTASALQANPAAAAPKAPTAPMFSQAEQQEAALKAPIYAQAVWDADEAAKGDPEAIWFRMTVARLAAGYIQKLPGSGPKLTDQFKIGVTLGQYDEALARLHEAKEGSGIETARNAVFGIGRQLIKQVEDFDATHQGAATPASRSARYEKLAPQALVILKKLSRNIRGIAASHPSLADQKVMAERVIEYGALGIRHATPPESQGFRLFAKEIAQFGPGSKVIYSSPHAVHLINGAYSGGLPREWTLGEASKATVVAPLPVEAPLKAAPSHTASTVCHFNRPMAQHLNAVAGEYRRKLQEYEEATANFGPARTFHVERLQAFRAFDKLFPEVEKAVQWMVSHNGGSLPAHLKEDWAAVTAAKQAADKLSDDPKWHKADATFREKALAFVAELDRDAKEGDGCPALLKVDKDCGAKGKGHAADADAGEACR